MKNLNKILSAIQAICALLMIGAVTIWAPPCDGLLELTSGKQIPMKCVHTGKAVIAVAIILLLTAIIGIFFQRANKASHAISGISAVMVYLLFTSFIGVCVKEMRCHTTARWGKIAAAVVLVTALIGLLSGKEGQIQD